MTESAHGLYQLVNTHCDECFGYKNRRSKFHEELLRRELTELLTVRPKPFLGIIRKERPPTERENAAIEFLIEKFEDCRKGAVSSAHKELAKHFANMLLAAYPLSEHAGTIKDWYHMCVIEGCSSAQEYIHPKSNN